MDAPAPVNAPAAVSPPLFGERMRTLATYTVPIAIVAVLPLLPFVNNYLIAVVVRALRNYLAGSATELAADLAAGAQVSMPALALTLGSLQSLQWAPGAGAVLAVVQAEDRRGAVGRDADDERRAVNDGTK